MKTLTLPAGTPYVRFDELAHLIAYAMHPLKDDDSAGDGLNYGFALVSLEAELQQAVESGALPAKNPLTLGPHVMHVDRLEDALVRVFDLQAYLGDRVLVQVPDSQKQETASAPAINWRPKPSIQRAPGYRWPLYQFLKRAHIAGTAQPKARDFLDDLSKHPNPDLQAMPDGLKYSDGLGNTKEANLRAIQAAIAGLVTAE